MGSSNLCCYPRGFSYAWLSNNIMTEGILWVAAVYIITIILMFVISYAM